MSQNLGDLKRKVGRAALKRPMSTHELAARASGTQTVHPHTIARAVGEMVKNGELVEHKMPGSRKKHYSRP